MTKAATVFSEDDLERMAAALARALQQARSVSDSEHYDHHTWIKQKIESEKARTEFWTAMLAHVLKWGAITILSGAFYAMYLGARAAIKLPMP